jgi:O-methyltransferase
MRYLYSRFLSFVLRHRRGILVSFIHPAVRNLRNGTILFYNEPYRARVFDRIGEIKRTIDFKLGYNEAYQIHRAVQSVGKVAGEMAEVGVYEGGSARVILEAEPGKTLHLFDTFEGLPQVSAEDSTWFAPGQYHGPLDLVKRNLADFPNVRFYKGLFPADTANHVEDLVFSFVNLDVDIYSSTRDSLEFFYPRMAKGGILMSHDYVSADGVRKAFDEFFADKPEPLVEMSGSQVLVVKC